MRGKPRSTLQKLIDGERNKDRINLNEPIPTGKIGEPPEWMEDDQKEIWLDALEQAPAGVLKTIDTGVFTTWVVAFSLHRRATKIVNEQGMQSFMETKQGSKEIANPMISVIARNAETMTRSATQLGFTPVARSKIDAGNGPNTPEDMMKALLEN